MQFSFISKLQKKKKIDRERERWSGETVKQLGYNYHYSMLVTFIFTPSSSGLSIRVLKDKKRVRMELKNASPSSLLP